MVRDGAGWWTEQVVPRLVDASLSAAPVGRLRARACAGLHGRVLEIGFGSGLNLPHLPAAVTALDAVEPADLAWERSAGRRAAAPLEVARTGLDGERLAAPDGSYDAVLCTFTLCTVPDPARALAEARRVLRPGGALHLLEHGLAPGRRVRGWQRRLEPLQGRAFGGCHLTRDVLALVRAAGLVPDLVHQAYVATGPARPWSYVTVVRAARDAVA
ncbi:class I SAM-dependent methyltransferase [Nocardioides sp. AX2bis]|uniref:class I SAM-dependent methyltransferase n=1 Tax=Nocardioides sp. AX2bis TaxID=2653157 RepID=UPI0012F35EBE|nr:class I SAM-dependent methyltransferase [Nocardioides sp. AX2bis]VXC16837.1 Putative methyltransferase YcgJ [Nocardioides sp. AX2bis]